MSELARLYQKEYDRWARRQVDLLKKGQFVDLDLYTQQEVLNDEFFPNSRPKDA